MTSLSFWKILAGCTLAGVLAAGIWSVTLPKRYVSTAVMRISGGPALLDHLQAVQQAALSRESLASIIAQQNLYPNERKKYPLDNVIQEMRNRHLRIQRTDAADGMTFAVSFDNENPAAAQATVRAIINALAEQNVIQGNVAASMKVLDAASLWSQPVGPNRVRVIGGGLGAGLMLGLVCGGGFSIMRRKERWSFRRIGGFAAAGMALGLTVAFLIPDEFVSTAVLRTTDIGKLQFTLTEVLSDDSLAAIVRQDDLFSRELSNGNMSDVTRKMRNEFIRVQQVQAGPDGGAIVLSFRYPDRWKAQAVTRDLVNRFFIMSPQHTTEVLDPASPAAPNSPNRTMIAVLGTVLGILLGLAASRFRRTKLAAA
jgi:capsular polysaccharide biosynthesis protein